MKKLILLLPFLLTIFFLVGLLGWWNLNSKAVSSETDEQRFVILPRSSAVQVGNKLAEEGLIKSPLAFKVYVQLMGKQKNIQAGEYHLSPNLSLTEIVEQLTKGPDQVWVTIPEGLRREEVAERFIGILGKSGDEAKTFREEFLALTQDKEGYLFPDTYLFPKTAPASLAVTTMSSNFDRRVDEALRNDIANSGLTFNQIITLAAIIERETKTNEERPIVAGILLKRLNAGWPLQVDATVQYAVGTRECSGRIDCNWWPILTKEDMSIVSVFNSYTNTNLPPGPIASPGLSSIRAVVYPEESPYWFYIHDNTGKIHYAETLREHNENIAEYLQR